MNPRINKLMDFIERVGWTAIQSAAGALLVFLTEPDFSWQAAGKVVGTAALVAALKVIVAQRTGDNELGATVRVIETR